MTSRGLTGVPQWQRNLNRRIRGIRNLSEAGLLEGALFIQAASQKEVPRATGNLANSAFTVSSSGKVVSDPKFTGKSAGEASRRHEDKVSNAKAQTKAGKAKGNPSAQTGYSAVYALRVHENPRAGKTGGVSPSGKRYTSGKTESGNKSTRRRWAQTGKWKFLEDPVKRDVRKVFNIIARQTRRAF